MMPLHRSFISLVLAIIVLLLISQSVGVVPEGRTGVRLRFGSVVEAGLKPGLHFKLPFMEQITSLDAQWITLDGERENGGRMKFVTADDKTFDTGYAAVWRISDAGVFCRATDCDEGSGARRINDVLTSLLRQLFAAHTSGELLTGSDTALLRDLPVKLNAQLHAIGAEVQAVHLTALTLPRDQLDAVYQRMRAQQSAPAAPQQPVPAGSISTRNPGMQRSNSATALSALSTFFSVQGECTSIRACQGLNWIWPSRLWPVRKLLISRVRALNPAARASATSSGYSFRVAPQPLAVCSKGAPVPVSKASRFFKASAAAWVDRPAC